MQLWTNWTNGSTGQLSAMTVTLQGLRCMGRCYSNIIETGDMFRIALYAEASLLNGAILSQIIYYGYGRGTSNTGKTISNITPKMKVS